jgi:hypothetical protein
MKRNLLALAAIVMAVIFSSFTIKPLQTVYFVYDGSGNQADLANYQSPAPTSYPGTVAGSSTLAWFRGDVADPGDIQLAEFDASFDAIDNQMGGTIAGTLDDETEDGIVLEKQ